MKSVMRNLLPLLLCFMIDRFEGKLLSRNKSVRMVNYQLDWVAERAIDGVSAINHAERCGCCAGTAYTVDPWFEIDLLHEYNITTIDVQRWPTDAYNLDYEDMEVYLTWQRNVGNSSPVYTQKAATFQTTVTFTNPVLTRFITLVLAGRARLLVICELEVYGDCGNDRFGEYCENTCNCLGAPCDKTTGICPSNVCKAGYSGSQCNQDCIEGKYGENCAGVCGACHNGTVCNKTDGKCDMCEPGYLLPQCQKACPAGSFGVNCSTICGRCKDGQPCSQISGVCANGCQAGYTGITCQTACQAGSYGHNCSLECGQCKDDTACDVTSGACTKGCKAGMRGPLCDIECVPGTYGDNCRRNCGKCQNGKPCNRYTGTCQGCDPGYLGVFCNRTCLYGKYGYSCLQECGHCANGTTCNIETGVCTSGCVPGFLGTYCKQECTFGFYGINCQLLCGNCKDNVTCNVTSGNCENGCTSGFSGSLCIQAYQKQSQNTLSTEVVIAIGGASVFIVAVITVIVIVVFIIKYRKTRRYGDTQSHNTNGAVPTTTELDDVPPPSPPQAVNDVVDLCDESVKHEYDGFKTRQRGVRQHDLWEYIYDRKTNGCVQFYKEFAHLKSGMAHLYDSANKEENKQKNRYRGLCAYDHSRVKLEVEDGKPDYINASFINGFGKMSKFIATQGPTELTTDDFWLMVWQQQSAHIVMLTNLTERGREKCFQYWPDDGAEKYGNINILLTSTDKSPHFTVRQLDIWMIGQTKRRVTQYHFKDWPDKDVPSTTWSIVTIWRTVMADYNARRGDSGPLVVHCSAGIGRTGTFIALDNLYQQFQIEGCITPLNSVDSLRDQRVNMVQTKEQYVYLHETIADALLIGSHDIKPKQLPEIYEFLREQDDKHPAMTRLEVQHRLILTSKKNEVSEISSLATIREEPENSNMASVNKSFSADEQEDATNTLKTLNLPLYHGVSWVSYQYYWSMYHNTRQSVVMLTTQSQAQRRTTITTIVKKSLSNSQTVLEVQNSNVEIVEERVTDDYMLETFTIPQTTRDEDQSSSFDLTFLEFRIWNESTDVPSSIASTLRCIEAVRERQQQLSDSQPILIICRDNIPSAGLLCTLLSEIDRCTGPIGMVNIIESAKLMRECNSDILDKLEHYTFIYECLTEFIQQLTIYQNV